MDFFSPFGIHDTDNDLCFGKIGVGKECIDNRIDQGYSPS
jgi:hypothetical protein